jgi:hypothetical protein
VRRAQPDRGRNTIRSRFLAEETQELYDRLGEFERRVVGGSVILRWDLGEGDGMIVARKSTEDSRNGETIAAQLQPIVRYCDSEGHKPRIVVAVLSLSGRARYQGGEPRLEPALARPAGLASVARSRSAERCMWSHAGCGHRRSSLSMTGGERIHPQEGRRRPARR